MSNNAGNAIDSGLQMTRDIVLGWKNTAGRGTSIADIAKIGRIEPLTLVSSNLKTLDEIYDIQHGILDVVAAFYSQGISILATKMVDPRILKILDSVNPDRDLRTVTTALSIENNGITLKRNFDAKRVANFRKYTALEGLEFGLRGELLVGQTLTGESSYEAAYRDLTGYSVESLMGEPNLDPVPSTGATKIKLDSFEESEKTVGKVIEVSFQSGTDDKQTVSIPLIVKLDNVFIPPVALENIVTMNEDKITFGSRFSDMLAGRIRPIRDFLLCGDLIKKQKQSLIKDPTRTYSELLNRINKSRLFSILSRNVSLGSISGVMILSDTENDAIKAQLGGDLTNKRTRQMVFDNTSCMMIAVVDRTYEEVSIFIRDLDGYSTAPFSAFKGSSRNGNSDQIAEIFKSMQMGRVPTF